MVSENATLPLNFERCTLLGSKSWGCAQNPLLSGNLIPYLTGKVSDHVAHVVVLV